MPEIKPRPFDGADRDIEENLLALKDHVEDKDYKLWLPARVWQTDLDVGATSAEGAYISAPYWEFPDGKESIIATTHYRPDYWRRGYLGLSIYYTGDTGSTNNVFWQPRITGYIEDGTAFTTETGDVTVMTTQLAPGPATADELKIKEISAAGRLAWTAQYPLISVILRRQGGDGSDTYAGEARFLGALLRYYPTRR